MTQDHENKRGGAMFQSQSSGVQPQLLPISMLPNQCLFYFSHFLLSCFSRLHYFNIQYLFVFFLFKTYASIGTLWLFVLNIHTLFHHSFPCRISSSLVCYKHFHLYFKFRISFKSDIIVQTLKIKWRLDLRFPCTDKSI